jgi:hypothetical protein
MESSVAVITYDQLNIVIVEIFLTDLTSHILQSFVPFLSTDISRPKPKIPLTLLGSTQTLSQRGAVYIKLIVKSQLFIFFDIS